MSITELIPEGVAEAPGAQDEQLPPGMKRCTRCRLPKLLTEFYKGRARKNAKPGDPVPRMSWCKDCHQGVTKLRRKERLVVEGEAYLKAEAERVRSHVQDPVVADLRSAAARAVRVAEKELRERHREEYQRLLRAARKAEGLAA